MINIRIFYWSLAYKVKIINKKKKHNTLFYNSLVYRNLLIIAFSFQQLYTNSLCNFLCQWFLYQKKVMVNKVQYMIFSISNCFILWTVFKPQYKISAKHSLEQSLEAKQISFQRDFLMMPVLLVKVLTELPQNQNQLSCLIWFCIARRSQGRVTRKLCFLSCVDVTSYYSLNINNYL